MIVLAKPTFTLPPAVRGVLDDFHREHGLEARLWKRGRGGWSSAYPPGEALQSEPGPGAVPIEAGGEVALCVEVAGAPAAEAGAFARFLACVLSRSLTLDAEVRSCSREIAERYEEITLLYSISEILGSVISLEQAAGTILAEVASVLGIRRATLWVRDLEHDRLDLVAAVGGEGQTEPIQVADRCSITAQVFRESRSILLDPADVYPRPDCPPVSAAREYFLSVPVSYTPPKGATRTVGVINLTGRGSDEPFSAGDVKLVSAIASQIGAAVENSRLVSETLRQERLVREMELAHDLQLKLLPAVEQFAGYAEVAARCAPAESVGGDFYHLFRLSNGRFGVMIGDVSSHGFAAALIMALTMSAAAIHASEGHAPAEVLRRIHRALIDELETTEMYLTLFYSVIDPRVGAITYANAGHSHAFRLTADGPERLAATSPPFGLVNLETYGEATAPWHAGEDLLFLFTDGLSDSLGLGETEGEQTLLDAVEEHAAGPTEEVIERLFSLSRNDAGVPADDRTAILVRL